ncbi:hypothetical protein HMPREF9088_2312 [Enterococcus italicus DSM 15952]|uniref:Uncharacterized protein n=1 Tax=Enterococcus italicus (strain DSM 15952 / CCUG 50447 / LMG 22039 / TP 1.5) TaxID=888064 RepID=E6LIX2_ENTI1|nr:hypothetical protein HMPREF9088_2312 [Enterococcus italicus DSM 15952]
MREEKSKGKPKLKENDTAIRLFILEFRGKITSINFILFLL